MYFAIYRVEIFDQCAGGVLLAVRNSIPSLNRADMENSAEILVCWKLCPSCKKKVLMAVFYRPLSSDCSYLTEFTKLLREGSRVKFDQLLIVPLGSLPPIEN